MKVYVITREYEYDEHPESGSNRPSSFKTLIGFEVMDVYYDRQKAFKQIEVWRNFYKDDSFNLEEKEVI